jgi:hypothetical protein
LCGHFSKKKKKLLRFILGLEWLDSGSNSENPLGVDLRVGRHLEGRGMGEDRGWADVQI